MKRLYYVTYIRTTLFDLIGHYIPKFDKKNKTEKLNIILVGFNIENDDYIHINTILTKAVQNYILKTKSLIPPQPPPSPKIGQK